MIHLNTKYYGSVFYHSEPSNLQNVLISLQKIKQGTQNIKKNRAARGKQQKTDKKITSKKLIIENVVYCKNLKNNTAPDILLLKFQGSDTVIR